MAGQGDSQQPEPCDTPLSRHAAHTFCSLLRQGVPALKVCHPNVAMHTPCHAHPAVHACSCTRNSAAVFRLSMLLTPPPTLPQLVQALESAGTELNPSAQQQLLQLLDSDPVLAVLPLPVPYRSRLLKRLIGSAEQQGQELSEELVALYTECLAQAAEVRA